MISRMQRKLDMLLREMQRSALQLTGFSKGVHAFWCAGRSRILVG
jgi:hypothetical protein